MMHDTRPAESLKMIGVKVKGGEILSGEEVLEILFGGSFVYGAPYTVETIGLLPPHCANSGDAHFLHKFKLNGEEQVYSVEIHGDIFSGQRVSSQRALAVSVN